MQNNIEFRPQSKRNRFRPCDERDQISFRHYEQQTGNKRIPPYFNGQPLRQLQQNGNQSNRDDPTVSRDAAIDPKIKGRADKEIKGDAYDARERSCPGSLEGRSPEERITKIEGDASYA
jgi:hypothetical protein